MYVYAYAQYSTSNLNRWIEDGIYEYMYNVYIYSEKKLEREVIG